MSPLEEARACIETNRLCKPLDKLRWRWFGLPKIQRISRFTSETMWDLDGSAVRKINEWRIFLAGIRQDLLWQCRAPSSMIETTQVHTSWNLNYWCHLKLFDAEAVGNPICCNPLDCVCWSLLVVLLIVTYFFTRALPSQTLQRVFHDALGSCCMAKPLVLPGLVLRLLTLKSCTVSLQVTWQNMKFHAKSIVKTPDDKLSDRLKSSPLQHVFGWNSDLLL